MRRIFPRTLAVLALAAAASVASAQTGTEVRQAVSRFPDAQAVLYFNANRIVNEAMPRVMPRAEYQKMVDEAKQVGVDVRGLDYAVIGVRLAPQGQGGGQPEVAAMVRGSFNANALLTLARTLVGEQAKAREETYGSRTLLIFELPKKEQTKGGTGSGTGDSTGTSGGTGTGGGTGDGTGGVPGGDMMPSLSEVAAVALDANTLVVGVPSYVKAAVDVESGTGGLKSSLVDLAARDRFALMSLTADLPADLPDYLQKFGVGANDEVRRVLGWLKSLSFSTGMEGTNFTTKVAVLTSAPEHASTLDGMLQFGLTAAEAALRSELAKSKDPSKIRPALSALQSLTRSAQGSTLEVGIAVPQATVAEMIRKEMSQKKKAAGPGSARAKARPRAGRRGAARRR